MPAARPSDLQDHLGYWLRLASNAVSHSFARRLEGEGVTVAEWVFVRMLYAAAPISPSLLAERMGMTKGAISKLSDRLLEKNLVEREPSPVDARAHVLALTAAGRALIPRLAAIADDNDAQFFDVLAVDERRRLRKLLGRLAAAHKLTHAPTE